MVDWYNERMSEKNLNLPIELEELRTILRNHGVIKASVFGSYSRGEGRAESDLDLLVTLDEGRTYLDLGGLQFELSERISGDVDIMTRLNRHFEPYIRDDLVEIL
jgi:predicted nucleotidyltransferase